MQDKRKLFFIIIVLGGLALACGPFNDILPNTNNGNDSNTAPDIPDPVLEGGVSPAEMDPNEPVVVTGFIPYTSPFFLSMASEPFVLLEDQAGFVDRDQDFVFPLPGQAIGPVWQIDDDTMGFSLSLPAVPQATYVDVDNNGQEDKGLMVFAVAFWSNTWGGPFLEEREGTGWSGAHSSTIVDPDRENEIVDGHFIIWAPDDQQAFPSGFGEDEMLFTEDDPVQPVPAGYSIVDLSSEPFAVFKEANPEFELVEGSWQVKDYSDESYSEAFDHMFETVSIEYPFTTEKNLDWDAIYAEFAPEIDRVNSDYQYYQVLREFTYAIPDGHVGLSSEEYLGQAFSEEAGGSFGLVLAELSDGRVIVTQVLPGTTGAEAGIQVGAEIITWEGLPVTQALDKVEPFFAPYSTPQQKRLEQLIFLPRVPVFSEATFTYQNPGASPKEVTLEAPFEIDSLFEAYPTFDPIEMPIEGETLPSGFGYIKIATFNDDLNLMAQIWQRHMENIIEEGTPGLILDLRDNGGGFSGLALNFAGFFFDETILVARHSTYNHLLGEWEYSDYPTEIEPAPMYYDGPIVILTSPNCVSACEGFTYWLTQHSRAIVVGYTGTAGAYGGVGSGQYTLPGGVEMQFPTSRSETPNGDLIIEGVGVQPDVIVPLTYEDVLGQADTLLDKAVELLQDM
ncbi:MAG: S41 family peptidase [Anaerolineales bacterium]|jgi:C-terminal processing protease CtpA/Prc